MPTKIYNSKTSWEAYAHEEPEKHVRPDFMHHKYYAVWRDKIGYRAVDVTQTQHNAFRRLTNILGHEHMMDKGMNLVNVVKLMGKPTIKSMVKKGIFKVINRRLWLTSNHVPNDDPFIENGLREGGKALRVSYCEQELIVHTSSTR